MAHPCTATKVLPALPLLGSALLSDGELDAIFDEIWRGRAEGGIRRDKERIGTGIKSVDEALGGGVRKGKGGLVAISGEKGVGKMGLSLCLLTTSLLSSPKPNSYAAIIDITGNLDPILLYNIILSRLQADPSLSPLVAGETLEDAATKVLERVSIMRVFDLEGVIEAVGEVRDGLEMKAKATMPTIEPISQPSEIVPRSVEVVKEAPKKIPKTEIADSEDEDEDMLFESAPTSQHQAPSIPSPSQPAPDSEPRQPEPAKTPDIPSPSAEGKTEFILIDNLAHVLNPLLKNDHVQANTLLTHLLTTLSHLTRTHNLITILLNPASAPRPVPSSQQVQQRPSPSIFSSVPVIPSLTLLDRYVDLHVLVSKLPWREIDAKLRYDGDSGRRGRNVEMV
ncbi:hypothetical protein K469DRAFT_700008, partial [Zopfia rhizophila CBS 207.26]